MPSESDESAFRALLDGQATFDELAPESADEVEFYNDLRDVAKRAITSFEDLLEFHRICIEQGPSGFVWAELERNTARSLKNMVLRDNRAGSRVPITTAEELHRRIKAYQELGVESVSPQAVVFTLLEHIFDGDEYSNVPQLLNSLLQSYPDTPETTNPLVRARFVTASETLNPELDVLDYHLDVFFSDIVDPRSSDSRTAEELLEAADDRRYSDPEKPELVCASLAREQNIDAFRKFLYLNAADTVERYRHKDTEDPWRGELQLAVRQFDCILNLFAEELSSERRARVNSYRSVALGELRSGNRWRSQKDHRNLPEPNFMSAAGHYVTAAETIEPVDSARYLKYLSKSFRHQATGMQRREYGPHQGWGASRRLHSTAVEVITEVAKEYEDDGELQNTAVGLVASHNFLGNEAAAVAAFEQGDPGEISVYVTEAREHKDAVPTMVETGLLEAVEELSFARRQEHAGEYAQALTTYQGVEDSRIDLENRIALVKLKELLNSGDYSEAVGEAESVFESHSPLTTGVKLIAGEEPSAPAIKPPVLDDIAGVNNDVKWKFVPLTHLATGHGENDQALTPAVETLFFEL